MILEGLSQEKLREHYKLALNRCPGKRPEIAKHLGTSSRTVSRRVNGEAEIRPEHVYAVYMLAYNLADKTRDEVRKALDEQIEGFSEEEDDHQIQPMKNPNAHHSEKDWEDLTMDDLKAYRDEIVNHESAPLNVRNGVKKMLDDPNLLQKASIKSVYTKLREHERKCEENAGK